MNEPAHQDLLETAVRGAKAGAEVLLHYFRGRDLQIEAKDTHDLVSRADHESEARVIAEIQRRFPDHRILAEESGWRGDSDGGEAEYDWIIDPLDGTANFLQGLPVFCLSIACRHRGDLVAGTVYDPVGDNLFTAVRGGGAHWNGRPMRVSEQPGLEGAFLATGYPFRARKALDLYLDVFREVFLTARAIRRCGAAALDLAYTAAGVYDGFFEFRLSPWDIAAGALLVREAGGVLTDLDGDQGFLTCGNVVAGPRRVQPSLLAAVRRHADESKLEEVDPLRNKSVPAPVG